MSDAKKYLWTGGRPLEARIDRLAFQRVDTENAFVIPAKRFTSDQSHQRFDTERELAECQGTLLGNRAAVIAACDGPARKAARVEPIVAPQYE